MNIHEELRRNRAVFAAMAGAVADDGANIPPGPVRGIPAPWAAGTPSIGGLAEPIWADTPPGMPPSPTGEYGDASCGGRVPAANPGADSGIALSGGDFPTMEVEVRSLARAPASLTVDRARAAVPPDGGRAFPGGDTPPAPPDAGGDLLDILADRLEEAARAYPQLHEEAEA